MTQTLWQAVLLDIEGTTTSIRFVYDTLFPYAREALEAHVLDADASETFAQVARDSAQLGGPEVDPARPDTVLASLRWQMDHDHKATGLKALQGDIWRRGYQDGTLKGHLYPDVEGVLRELAARRVPVYIYSSGSIAAQRLLFGHSIAGDLLGLLAGHFDTTTGPKKVAASYTQIAGELGVAPQDVLFGTDNLDEARAARDAGMQVRLLRRPGNPDVPADHGFVEAETLEFLID